MNGEPRLGLFGKVPWEGDFIQRGLPSQFIQPWDEWLSRAMAVSREALGAHWPGKYLVSPPWFYLLEAGLVGPQPWTGVLVSSIDKVKRCYPLTIAASLDAGEDIPSLLPALKGFYRELEAVALAVLEGQHSLEDVLQEAGRMATQSLAAARRQRPHILVWGNDGDSNPGAVVSISEAPELDFHRDREGSTPRSLWWRESWDRQPATTMSCQGLPPAAGFAALFDGLWDQHGWRHAKPMLREKTP